MTTDLEELRYPVGRFQRRGAMTPEERTAAIDEIAGLPRKLRDAVENLSDEQLDTPYRPDGWTIRQVVHHLPDSHVNSYVRFKLAMTEETPGVRTYDEAAWAELDDGRAGAIEQSLALLDALHERWTGWLRTFKDGDWQSTFQHPEWGAVPLDVNLQIYEWHCRHHLAHITGLRGRMGWS